MSGLVAVSRLRRQASAAQETAAERREQLDAYRSLCDDIGEASAAVALAWLLHQDPVTATIVGPASVDQLRAVLHVPDIVLPDDVCTRLDEIFPPVGEAPEAYAW